MASPSAPVAPVEADSVYIDEQGQTHTEKLCSHCGHTKPLNFFYKKTRGKYGRQEWCKRCMGGKPAMSATEELSLRAETTGAQTVALEREPEMTAKTVAAPTTTGETPETTTEIAAQGEVVTAVEEENGRVGFSAWVRATGSPIFATPDFAVVRVQGTSMYTIHLSANASERVRALVNYIPAGAIPPNFIELLTRMITDTLTQPDKDILGYAYY